MCRKRAIYLMILMAAVSLQKASAEPHEFFCSFCGIPEIDWQRYANLAYNVYFISQKYYEGRPQNRIIGDQILIRGVAGCEGPTKDWVLVNFKYNWENLDGEIVVGPYGAKVSVPIFHNNIEWIAQLPNGSQRDGFFLAESDYLDWTPSEMMYPPGALDCPPEDDPNSGNYLSVIFPWGDGLECLTRGSVFGIVLCAVERGFRCPCGNHDGHYSCIMPYREGQPLP